MSFTYNEKNNPCFRWTERYSQFNASCHWSSKTNFAIVFPTRGLRAVVRTIVSWGTTGSSKLHQDCGILCRGRRTHINGHSNMRFFRNLKHPPSSPQCMLIQHGRLVRQPRNLSTTSISFTEVHCEADDPCSVNTAYTPESSWTISSLSKTRPLYFWCCGSNSTFWRWRVSINVVKKTCFISLFVLPERPLSSSLPLPSATQRFSRAFQFCVHCSFRIRSVIAWGMATNVVPRSIATYRIEPFLGDVILVIGVNSCEETPPCGSMSFQAYFVFLRCLEFSLGTVDVGSAIGNWKLFYPHWAFTLLSHRAFERGFLTAPQHAQPQYFLSNFSQQPMHIRRKMSGKTTLVEPWLV